jgi:hypothetical protein
MTTIPTPSLVTFFKILVYNVEIALHGSCIRANQNAPDLPESGRAILVKIAIWSAQIGISAIWVVLKLGN